MDLRHIFSTQPLTGRAIQYTFDAQGQRITTALSGAGDPRTITYTYDQAARLRSLTDSAVGAQPFIYDYQPGTNWTASLTTPTGSTTRWERDTLGRVKETRFHGSGGQPLSGFAYTYDAAGQRSTESGPRGNIAFGYNSRSELTTATGHAAGPFAYAYDPIGNRLSATQAAASLTYTPNALNHYTRIEQSGTAFTPIHDVNGNMTDDGKSLTLTYDEENRLIRIAQQKHGKHLVSEFTYDGLSRRVETREYENGQLIDATRYLYDGLLPIEEYKLHNSSFTPHTFLTRGPDLSGTFDGAGGIGGLLAFTENASTSHYFADANGNITALYNTSDTPTATYTYDPFGRLVASAGSLATRNAYQWSSKEHHAGSGLVYYLYRFYNPEEGRWVNRDPIEEEGGANLYTAFLNSPVILADPLGLFDITITLKRDSADYFGVYGTLTVRSTSKVERECGVPPSFETIEPAYGDYKKPGDSHSKEYPLQARSSVVSNSFPYKTRMLNGKLRDLTTTPALLFGGPESYGITPFPGVAPEDWDRALNSTIIIYPHSVAIHSGESSVHSRFCILIGTKRVCKVIQNSDSLPRLQEGAFYRFPSFDLQDSIRSQLSLNCWYACAARVLGREPTTRFTRMGDPPVPSGLIPSAMPKPTPVEEDPRGRLPRALWR